MPFQNISQPLKVIPLLITLISFGIGCGRGLSQDPEGRPPRALIQLEGGQLPPFSVIAPDAGLRSREIIGNSNDTNFKPLMRSSSSAGPSVFSQYFSRKHSQDPTWATHGQSTYPPIGDLKLVQGFTFYSSPMDIQEIEKRKGIFPSFQGSPIVFIEALQDELDGTAPKSPYDENILNPYYQSIAPNSTAFVVTTMSPMVAKGWVKQGWAYVVRVTHGIRMPGFEMHPWSGSPHPKAKAYEQQVLIPGSIKLNEIVGYAQVQGGKFTGQIYLNDQFKVSDPVAYNEAFEYLSGKTLSLTYDEMPDDSRVSGLRVEKTFTSGSTHPDLVIDDTHHVRYVRKDTDNNRTAAANAIRHIHPGQLGEHARNEALADTLYRTLEVPAPVSKYVQSAGKHFKISLFIPEARELRDYSPTGSTPDPVKYAAGLAYLREHFATDALLANWDIKKADLDNVMLDQFGMLWRVDNGGSLEFRAQGEYKGTPSVGHAKVTAAYDEFPTELFTLRSASFFKASQLRYSTIVDQMKRIVAKKADMLHVVGSAPCVSRSNAGKLLGNVIGARVDHMEFLITAFQTLTAAGKRDSQIEECSKRIMQDARAGTAAIPDPRPATAGGTVDRECFARYGI